MPAKATVFRWLASNPEFRRSFALARECQAEDFAYEILEIADDSSRDYVKKTGVDGKVTWVFDKEHIARQRLDTQPGAFTEFRIVLPRAGASLIKSGERA